MVFEHWSTHMIIRDPRKGFRATRLLACPRGFSQSRTYRILWRKLLPLHASALLNWLLWLSSDTWKSCQWLSAFPMATRTSVSSTFLSARVYLDPLSCQILNHNWISVIVAWLTTFTENLMVCRDQVTKFVCSKYGITCAFPTKSPCNFGSPAYYAISVLRDASIIGVVFQIPIPFLLARLFLILEKNLRVRASVSEHSSSSRFFSELFQPFKKNVQRVCTCSWCALIVTSAFGFSRPPQVPLCFSTCTLT